MTSKRSLRGFRTVLLRFLTMIPAALLPPAPADAQLPWIGLYDHGAQLFVEEGLGYNGPGAADYFGFAVAVGDFDGDGADDLATGIPGNDCDHLVMDCGAVQVQMGYHGHGLAAGRFVLSPLLNGQEPAKAHDMYGYALATGDFDNDGRDDLVVGIPGNDAMGSAGVDGAVQIHFGLPGGIQLVAGQYLAQGVDGVPQEIPITPYTTEERFGEALAVGDFNGDGHDDLAIGAPFAVRGSHFYRSGNVVVAHGHSGGLMPFDGFLMRQGLQGLPDKPENNEQFGYALAAGDFNGDGYDDLAIGVPGEDDVGAVLVVYGSPWSLRFDHHWYFGHYALGGPPQPGGRFGETLAVGDFDNDGYDDLAAGAPSYDGGGGEANMGLVTVLYGSSSGLTTSRLQWLFEWGLGSGTSERGDRFGSALAVGDFNDDGADDLAIGAEGESLESTGHVDTGAVTVVMGLREHGLLAARQLRPVGSTDPNGMIPDYRQGQPRYGAALATGDFDANGHDDLAIGAPVRDSYAPTTLLDAGAVAVIYGQPFQGGLETPGSGASPGVAP